MEQEYKGEIQGFPKEIVDRMLECQLEQGNTKDVSIFEVNRDCGKNRKGFTWSATKEGWSFWSEIINHKIFETFYKRYPKGEFKLLAKWCVASCQKVKEYFSKKAKDYIGDYNNPQHYNKGYFYSEPVVIDTKGPYHHNLNRDINFTLITVEQFEKYVLGTILGSPSKYQISKWYKSKNWTGVYFCKASYSHTSNRIYFSECIVSGNHEIKQDWWFGENAILASLEEIQKYLPDGHPDKIKSMEKNQFKAGEYIVLLNDQKYKYFTKNYIYLQQYDYNSVYTDCDSVGERTNGGCFFKNKSEWRYATTEEIAEYNRLGKPFDVTTLSKEEENLAGRYIKILKDRLSGSDTEAGKYYLISKSTKDEIVLNIPIAPYINRIESKYYEIMPEGFNLSESSFLKIPKYVECTESFDKSFSVGKIYTWPNPTDNNGTKRGLDFLNGSIWTFKSSTKEAYEAQNSKKEIKEWSVGTYLVFLKRYGSSELGDIDEIIEEESKHSMLKCRKEGVTTKSPDYTKWFATYKEAKECSDFLLNTSNFETGNSATTSNSSHNPYIEIILPYSSSANYPLTPEECFTTKESIKTQVISTNVIDIQLKTKKKKQLFTI